MSTASDGPVLRRAIIDDARARKRKRYAAYALAGLAAAAAVFSLWSPGGSNGGSPSPSGPQDRETVASKRERCSLDANPKGCSARKPLLTDYGTVLLTGPQRRCISEVLDGEGVARRSAARALSRAFIECQSRRPCSASAAESLNLPGGGCVISRTVIPEPLIRRAPTPPSAT